VATTCPAACPAPAITTVSVNSAALCKESAEFNHENSCERANRTVASQPGSERDQPASVACIQANYSSSNSGPKVPAFRRVLIKCSTRRKAISPRTPPIYAIICIKILTLSDVQSIFYKSVSQPVGQKRSIAIAIKLPHPAVKE
jgi:hypothetical protein